MQQSFEEALDALVHDYRDTEPDELISALALMLMRFHEEND